MYQAIYDSVWHHPGIAWEAAILLGLWLLRDRTQGFLRAYLVGFGLAIVLDAWMTSTLSPVSAALLSSVSIVFVIVGDWRLFVLVERAVGGGPAWVARSIGLAFVVPVLQAVAIKVWPDTFSELRKIYLVYELLFLALALVLRFGVLPGRLERASVAPTVQRWVLGAVLWFVVQYGLWAAADILILAGADWALLLRIVPNALYYGGFLLFVALTSPPEVREGGRW